MNKINSIYEIDLLINRSFNKIIVILGDVLFIEEKDGELKKYIVDKKIIPILEKSDKYKLDYDNMHIIVKRITNDEQV